MQKLWSQIKDAEVNPHTYELLILYKKPKFYNEKRNASSTNRAGLTGFWHVEEHK